MIQDKADTSPIDIEAALNNPSAYFDQPRDVLARPGLSKKVRLKLLRQWEYDARRLADAEGEGMGGGEESMLGRVRLALRDLEASMDDTGAGDARASVATGARKVAVGLGEAASQVRHAASRTQDHITQFRGFMRAQPITGALLMVAVGYLAGQIAGGRR